MPAKGTRRLDADDPRYADLPLVAFDAADGQDRVLRGQVGFTPEFARQRRWLETRPGVPHVVFVSRRGDVTLLPVGGRVAASDAADPRSVSRWSVPTLDGCADLSEVAAPWRAAAAEVEARAADLCDAPASWAPRARPVTAKAARPGGLPRAAGHR